MILMNLKNNPRSVTLDDGKTILLNPSQKNYKLPKKYQNDTVLDGYEKIGLVRILKEEETVKDDKKKKKGKKDKIEDVESINLSEEGDENE